MARFTVRDIVAVAVVGAACLSIETIVRSTSARSRGSSSAGDSAVQRGSPSSVQYERVLALQEREGVFAYARISPDGRTLAYASIMPDLTRPARPGRQQPTRTTQKVVDLASGDVLFSESGIDAYWSPDGERMIFLSQMSGVTIRYLKSGRLVRQVAPPDLGDYFSWARQDGRDLILTIESNYYFLDGDAAALPAARITSCPQIRGRGERPLISKDGRRATTFVRGTVVVRSLTTCDDIIDTGLKGGKADFSWDGRYIAFHVPKAEATGYDIAVVDLERRTLRTLGGLAGSSLFPSWTRDGRLCFRYDGDDYRGFMIASNVLSATERPLPAAGGRAAAAVRWTDLFPGTPRPEDRLNLVMVWAAWSAHSPYALEQLQRASRVFQVKSIDVSVSTTLDLSTRRVDADRLRQAAGVTLPEIVASREHLGLAEALNQMPTVLAFRDGVLVDRRLGAQSNADLVSWVQALSR